MISVKNLFAGIYAAFAADSTLVASLTGGMHKMVAPQGTDFPYAVFTLVTEAQNDTMDIRHPELLIQFNIYSESATCDAVLDIYEDLDTVYRDTALTVTGYSHKATVFEMGLLLADEPEGVFQYTVRYRVKLEKS